MAELELTKHFNERWRQYFGGTAPSVQSILRIMRRSILLNKGQLLYEEDGKQYRLLSTYWHPTRRLVIKVDWTTNPPQAVTVITEKSKKK